MTPALAISNVTKRFGNTTALSDISLDVQEDELLVVLGPTGAGKTTLLRCIAGLESPDHGTVSICGRDMTSAIPADRDVALVFQNFSLYPDWSVRENMAFPLRAPGRAQTEREISRRISWAADVLKIPHLLDRPATRLSGGEMQRVALGRAIVRRPGLFLMDEPLTNLDAKLRESLRVELVTLRRELGTPMIFVTHDQVEAMSMGDRIAVLHEGRFLQEGTPNEIYTRPCSPEVARQLGSPPINLVSVSNRDGYWAATDGTRIVANQSHEPEAIIGIRPEDFAPTGGTIPGEVKVVEHMGPTAIIVATWAGQNIHITLPKHVEVRVGDVLHPLPDSTRLSVWHSH